MDQLEHGERKGNKWIEFLKEDMGWKQDPAEPLNASPRRKAAAPKWRLPAADAEFECSMCVAMSELQGRLQRQELFASTRLKSFTDLAQRVCWGEHLFALDVQLRADHVLFGPTKPAIRLPVSQDVWR